MAGIPALMGIDISGSLKTGIPLVGAGTPSDTLYTTLLQSLEILASILYQALSIFMFSLVFLANSLLSLCPLWLMFLVAALPHWGVYGGLFRKGLNAMSAIERKDYLWSLEFASPAFIEAVLKAYRMADQGATTPRGKIITDEQDDKKFLEDKRLFLYNLN